MSFGENIPKRLNWSGLLNFLMLSYLNARAVDIQLLTYYIHRFVFISGNVERYTKAFNAYLGRAKGDRRSIASRLYRCRRSIKQVVAHGDSMSCLVEERI